MTSKRLKSETKYFENPYKVELLENADEKIRKQLDGLVQAIQNDYSYKNPQSDFSVYTGTAGISYMFFYLYEHSTDPKMKDQYLEQSFNYLLPSLEFAKHEKKRSKRDATFIMGEPGPYALAAVLYHIKNDTKKSNFYQNELQDFVSIVFDPSFKYNELLYGRVGFLYSLLFVSKHLEKATEPWIAEQITKLANLIIKLGREYELDCPLMYEWHKKTYLAGAHGVAGILAVLLQVPNLLQDETIKRDIKGTIDYIIGLKFPSHNFPTRVDGTTDELVQWCHGAPAIAMLLVDAYTVFKDEKYLKVAENASEAVWQRGLLRKGLSLCHGVGGNGFVFLKLFSATKDPKYEQMAIKFCEWMWSEQGSKSMQTPDNPFSLFEGVAGAVCYLKACLNRNEAIRFPAYDL